MSLNKGRPPAGGKSGDGQELTIVVDPDSNTAETGAQDTWARCLRVVRKLRRRGELNQFTEEFTSGRLTVDHPELVRAALALGRVDIGRATPPPPTEQQAADLEAWVTEIAAENKRNSRNEKWRRELRGLSPTKGNGKAIGPARLQRSKHSKEELLRRLRYVRDKHIAERGEFKREFLDHRNPHYINDEDGGFSSKQVPFLANYIKGNRDERSFDDDWRIVETHLEWHDGPKNGGTK